MSASRMISLRVGGGSHNGGDGILGSGDGGGNGGADAASQRLTNASMEDGKGKEPRPPLPQKVGQHIIQLVGNRQELRAPPPPQRA
ncbi:hypothetical protein Tco_0063894 [Tanacetum coccineum]